MMILELSNVRVQAIASSNFEYMQKMQNAFHKKTCASQQIHWINCAHLSIKFHFHKKRLTPERISLLYFKVLKTIRLDQMEPNSFRFQYR